MPRGDSRTLAKEFDEAYSNAISVWSPWLAKAKKDIKFRLGDQWSSRDRAYLEGQQRDSLVFNKVKRVVNLITGYQRKNRLALKVEPVEGSDDHTASQFSGLLQACMTKGNGYEAVSDAFEHGPVTTGMNLLEIELDYSLDPVNGDFRFKRVPYNALLLDPYFTERDLGDCKFILRRKWLSKDDLKEVFGDKGKEIDSLRPQGQDGKFPDSPPATNYQGNNLFRVDQFYRRSTREAKLLVDKLTGNFRIWSGDKKRLEAFLQAPDEQTGLNIGERVEVQRHYIKTVDLAIMVEDLAFYDGQDLLGIDDYPHVALLGYWLPEYTEMKDKLQGVVRCMRDPQKETNRRRLKVLDIIDSVISTGFKAEEDSVVSPKSLYQTGQNRVIWTRPGKLDKVQQLGGGEAPASLFKIMEVMDSDIMEMAGVEGLLQAPENQNQQIAASLAKLREAQGLTVLQDLFDNLRLAKKMLGQKMLSTIQNNWTPAKVQRILNQQPSPEFYNRDFGRYDCVASEGILTDSQKQMYYAQLLALKQMGAPVSWATLIKASPLEIKEEILGEIQKAEQGQIQAGQLEMASKQITDKLLQAETASRIAGAQEKTAKIKADMAKAGLDIAKIMAEIQNMDAGRIMSLLQMALDIERQGGLGLPGPAPPAANTVAPMPPGDMMTRR
jgi:hypothetical protein